jgi:curli biogenesis system outer membrane secretion channel CsgG
MLRRAIRVETGCALILAIGCVAGAGLARAAAPPPIPTCDRKLGTLAVIEPEDKWWLDYELESPEAVIKVFVSESKCFTLVDRGKGMMAAQQERAIAASGDLRGGSNVGKGQVKAADYGLVPDLVNKNAKAGGKKIGGMLGGLVGGGVGAIAGGVNLKSKTADVVLTMTDLRSTEQVALAQGHAKKTDIGWGGGAGGGWISGFASAGASSYANTDIGKVIVMAYLDAYTKLVEEVKNNAPDARADNVAQAVTMAKPGRMYEQPDQKATIVRDLDPGMMLYPSGDKQGIWWKVSDELGNEGWVPSTLFDLAR